MERKDLNIHSILHVAQEIKKTFMEIERDLNNVKIVSTIDFDSYDCENISYIPKIVNLAKDEIFQFYSGIKEHSNLYDKLRSELLDFEVDLKYSIVFVSIKKGDICLEIIIKHLNTIINDYKKS